MKTPPLALSLLLAAANLLSGQEARPTKAGPGPDPARIPMVLPEPANPKLPTLFLIGASAVRNGRDDGQGLGAAGQWGFGHTLPAFFDLSKINVVNRAVGGLSSRTYLTSGHWERTLALIKPGDFLLIQFGSNDDGNINDPARARASLPGTGDEQKEIDNVLTKKHEVVHTHGWYLRKFIDDARAKGATAIVCSMPPHKVWDNQGRIVRAANYITWTREVALQEKIGFINLNEIVAARYDELGRDKVMTLFPADEHDHTNLEGAQLVASYVVAGLKLLKPNPLAPYFSDQAAAIVPANASSLLATPAPSK
jgi:lysophospholipase L1-like esterase